MLRPCPPFWHTGCRGLLSRLAALLGRASFHSRRLLRGVPLAYFHHPQKYRENHTPPAHSPNEQGLFLGQSPCLCQSQSQSLEVFRFHAEVLGIQIFPYGSNRNPEISVAHPQAAQRQLSRSYHADFCPEGGRGGRCQPRTPTAFRCPLHAR